MSAGHRENGIQLPSDLLALPMGTLLAGSRYQLHELLGSGGFGKTYKATDRVLDRRVAIKEYFPSSLATRTPNLRVTSVTSGNGEALFQYGREKFIEEARTLARFRHPGIVRVNDFFEDNNTAYTVLEFEDGPNLAQWRANLNRQLSFPEVEHIAARVLDALADIHAHKIWHRDIAPDNIVLRHPLEPVLIDFGSARHNDKTRSLYRTVKQGYSAKEQYGSGSEFHGPWTDIYAFAATLYFLISGSPPIDSSDRDLGRDCPPAAQMSGYPKAFLAAIDWGMALRPDDRPQSIEAWREKLLAPGKREGPTATSAPVAAPPDAAPPDAAPKSAQAINTPAPQPYPPSLASPSPSVPQRADQSIPGSTKADQRRTTVAHAVSSPSPAPLNRSALQPPIAKPKRGLRSKLQVIAGIAVVAVIGVVAAAAIAGYNEEEERRVKSAREAERRARLDKARQDFLAEQQRQPSGRIRPRSAFTSDDDYGEHLQSELRQGSRVRMRTDEYSSIPRGAQGTFHGREPGGSSAFVIWDTAKPDGCFFANLHGSPAADNNRSSCVDFKDLEVIRQAPARSPATK